MSHILLAPLLLSLSSASPRRLLAPALSAMRSALLLVGAAMCAEALRPSQPSPRLQFHSSEPERPPCSWYYLEQPLDHFSGSSPGTFLERVCVINKYVDESTPTSIFLYVGNESPVEEYVNNTGLMYSLAQEHNALLVFAEHRYQGGSIPHTSGVRDCMSFCTVESALADYARLVQHLTSGLPQPPASPTPLPNPAPLDAFDAEPYRGAPVVAFGGSYGGMLAAYMRFKYPSSVAGAIAASAPIWGLPLTGPEIDGAAAVLMNGVKGVERCADNLKAGFVLINEVAKLDGGVDFLSEVFNTCESAREGKDIIDWVSSVWFLLAEGDFPFPSSYIPFAVGPGDYLLPAWPVEVACSNLASDFGVSISGSPSTVSFAVASSSSPLISVDVDWDESTNAGGFTLQNVRDDEGVTRLLEGMRDAANVWYNVTASNKCNDVTQLDGRRKLETRPMGKAQEKWAGSASFLEGVCTVDIAEEWKDLNCWEPMNCNDNLNMPDCLAQGMGRDFFWPPNVPRGSTLESLLGPKGALDAGCTLPDGLYGYPAYSDKWSYWMDAYFGGTRIDAFSNVVFSNGNLDPWSSAGVYKHPPKEGEMVQELNEDGNMIAIIIEQGAHHLDLFFPTEDDPESVKEARRVENKFIERYIDEWRGGGKGKLSVGDWRAQKAEEL